MTTEFYVLSNGGAPVAAQYLQYNGDFIPDPNFAAAESTPIYTYNSEGVLVLSADQNVHHWLIVPADYTIDNALAEARFIGSLALASELDFAAAISQIIADFRPGGPQDLQRNYDGRREQPVRGHCPRLSRVVRLRA